MQRKNRLIENQIATFLRRKSSVGGGIISRPTVANELSRRWVALPVRKIEEETWASKGQHGFSLYLCSSLSLRSSRLFSLWRASFNPDGMFHRPKRNRF
jgi:hypothetical protein